MIKRMLCDYKLICCAGKTVRCLEVVKHLICIVVFAFAAYESVMMLSAKK